MVEMATFLTCISSQLKNFKRQTKRPPVCAHAFLEAANDLQRSSQWTQVPQRLSLQDSGPRNPETCAGSLHREDVLSTSSFFILPSSLHLAHRQVTVRQISKGTSCPHDGLWTKRPPVGRGCGVGSRWRGCRWLGLLGREAARSASSSQTPPSRVRVGPGLSFSS